MKHAVSYVSGCAGNFIVNCCNHQWESDANVYGFLNISATVKNHEHKLNNADWLKTINEFPEQYIGTHAIERLLTLPVIPMWLIVPEIKNYHIWARRDFIIRGHDRLLGPSGNFYHKIKELVIENKSKEAAEVYLDWATNYNWVLMQMRLVQTSNKIDISNLLNKNGIDDIIDQIPQLKSVEQQCRQYHTRWLEKQLDFSEESTINALASKLSKFVNENS